jgi:cytochrome c oxidase subunit III
MSLESGILTPDERDELEVTVLVRHRLEEQYADLAQQHATASLGMWVFLATEVMFFGTLFLGLFVYRHQYSLEFEKASERLNWLIGGTNTVVLLISSLMMVLAVHFARHGQNRAVQLVLALTALLGLVFLLLKGVEYYLDYRENLIPGWRFEPAEWVARDRLTPGQVAHVQLFLVFYWVMTSLHALHMIIGIAAVAVMFVLTRRGAFSPEYYSPIDVTALYWHFVDIVWIFLLPSLYLLGNR